MADSIGIQIAYSTYKKIAKQKPQTKLPGLENITNDELFFLSFANVSYLIKFFFNISNISTVKFQSKNRLEIIVYRLSIIEC